MLSKGLRSAVVLAVVVLAGGAALAQTPVGMAFTYQGRLTDGGVPANGTYDLQFALYDAASGGGQVGPTLTREDVAATSGLFAVVLDFGPAFGGEKRFLEIAARPGTSTGSYTTLSGRQELTPTPNAIFSAMAPWPGLLGVPPGFADGVDDTGSGTVTSITAGSGLTGGTITTSGTIGVSFGTTGTTVASGDHLHFGQAWSGAAANGLSVANSDATGTGIAGTATATSGATSGVRGRAESTGGTGVYGIASATSGLNWGVRGQSDSVAGRGVLGVASATSGSNVGVLGATYSTEGVGVQGAANATSGSTHGVYGRTNSAHGCGVYGVYGAGSALANGGSGICGETDINSITGYQIAGVVGLASGSAGYATGIYGQSDSTEGVAITGIANAGSGDAYGVLAVTYSTAGTGVWGSVNTYPNTGFGVYGNNTSSTGYAGYFHGNVSVTGTLSKGGGAFKIDHPLDPENKYLYHSFVESPDMKNIYDGVVTTDASGSATIAMPEWFEALNRDFRYQLTVIDTGDSDAFVQAKVVREISGNQFAIRTSMPATRVSWQVTGIRKDAWAETNRIPVEQDKSSGERGTYLHPDAFGQPKEMGLDHKRFPRQMDRPHPPGGGAPPPPRDGSRAQ